MRHFILPLFMLGLTACSTEYDLAYHQWPIQLTDGDKVDILLVLDTSCSMRDDYSTIYYGLGRTADDINDINADWRLAITNADPAGELIEIPPQTDEPGWGLMAAVDEINGGGSLWGASNIELLFETAEAHYDWLRPGAMTFLIFVSDEREQSDMTPEEFMNSWPNETYITSIVGPEEESGTPGGPNYCSAEAAPRFHAVTDYYVNICTSEPWSIVEEYNAQDEQ